MQFFDSHAHLTYKNEFTDIEKVLQRAKISNVTKIINICTDEKSLERGIELFNGSKDVFNVASTTCHDVEKEGEIFFPYVEKAIENNLIIAIGETGLDYHYELSKREDQKKYFVKYLDLAKRKNFKVVIHVRDAFDDLFKILDENFLSREVLLHCYTSNIENAKKALDRNYFISFSGIITFKKSNSLREVVKYVPIDKMLIETDSPYLAPEKYRGKRNEPSYVVEVCKTVAEVKNIDLEIAANKTFENGLKFFSKIK